MAFRMARALFSFESPFEWDTVLHMNTNLLLSVTKKKYQGYLYYTEIILSELMFCYIISRGGGGGVFVKYILFETVPEIFNLCT